MPIIIRNAGIRLSGGGGGGGGGGGSGTVTSVGLSMPGIFITTGSPITSAGTIAVTFADTFPGTVLASSLNGPGQPSFRPLVISDIPNLSTIYITADGTYTLKNKTISAANNTITGLTDVNLSGNAAIRNQNLQFRAI